jgi:hypothetical protein
MAIRRAIVVALGVMCLALGLGGWASGRASASAGAVDARRACLDVRAAAQRLPMGPVLRPGPTRVRRELAAALVDGRDAASANRRWRMLYRRLELANQEIRRHSDIAGALGGQCFSILGLS